MIHHISIPAENPLHVARVLAKICKGIVAPFPSHPDSYFVLMGDEQGTALEVYPWDTELMPGIGEEAVVFVRNPLHAGFSATHLALSVTTDQEEIEQIAAREGWRTLRCSRGGYFEVIEFWVENRLMMELLPPGLTTQYQQFMQPQNLEQLMAGLALARV
jgi:hypothetical protein